MIYQLNSKISFFQTLNTEFIYVWWFCSLKSLCGDPNLFLLTHVSGNFFFENLILGCELEFVWSLYWEILRTQTGDFPPEKTLHLVPPGFGIPQCLQVVKLNAGISKSSFHLAAGASLRFLLLSGIIICSYINCTRSLCLELVTPCSDFSSVIFFKKCVLGDLTYFLEPRHTKNNIKPILSRISLCRGRKVWVLWGSPTSYSLQGCFPG